MGKKAVKALKDIALIAVWLCGKKYRIPAHLIDIILTAANDKEALIELIKHGVIKENE